MRNDWKYVTEAIRPLIKFSSARESYDFTLAEESVKEKAVRSVTNIILEKARKHFSNDVTLAKISSTGGDITKMEGYSNIKLVLAELRKLTTAAKEKDVSLLNDLDTIMEYLEKKKDIFKKAFASKSEASMFFYTSAVFSVYHSATMCTLLAVEYWKDNANNWNTRLKHFGYNRLSKDSITSTANTLASYIREGKANNILAKDTGVANESMFGYANKAGLAIGVIAGITAIILIIRVIMVYTMAARINIAQYLTAQSDFLEINAKRNRNENREAIAKKQEIYVERLRKMSKFIDIESQQGSAASEKEKTQPITENKPADDEIM